jgi:hypothetical protein
MYDNVVCREFTSSRKFKICGNSFRFREPSVSFVFTWEKYKQLMSLKIGNNCS